MELTPIEIQLKKIAIFLGVLQGLAYAILALICIVLYNRDAIESDHLPNYMDSVRQKMYYILLSPEELEPFDQTLVPKVFTGFAWIYFILHIGWLGVSAFAALKTGIASAKYLTAWSHLTLLISVWDFITVVILGSDYNKCMDWISDNIINDTDYKISAQEMCSIGFLPALVIAARGFILWVVNVIFAVVLHYMAKQLKQGQVYSQHVPQPLGFEAQKAPAVPQPQFQGYNQNIPQSPQPVPHMVSPPQNVNRNPTIPEPDYYNQQPTPHSRRH